MLNKLLKIKEEIKRYTKETNTTNYNVIYNHIVLLFFDDMTVEEMYNDNTWNSFNDYLYYDFIPNN